MKFTDKVRNAVRAWNQPQEKTTNSNNPARDFLRFGNRGGVMPQDWSQVEISDKDMYTGYPYAVINKRANRAVVLGKRFLYTDATNKILEKARDSGDVITHPYLPLIRESKDFSERSFWFNASTYLDLEGVFYVLAVRAISRNAEGEATRVGKPQKFQLLNPYEVKRVINGNGELGGYVEQKNGRYREIPKEMMIEIKLLNPFDQELPYSMTDAAQDSQYTLKQAGDYTRHAVKGNINAPGILTTDVILEDQIFDNFISRVQNHTKGEPLYGNGSGAIHWEDMQTNLDRAALDKINEIHRSVLFAVSGASKTMMGIEETGTGREVSRTQRDDFTENTVMPQLENIIDALNLDYRKWYTEWDTNKYEIKLDNPLETDREAELKDIEIRERELEVRDTLVAMGYEYRMASQYAQGKIDLEELGEPTLEPELSDIELEAQVKAELGLSDNEETDPDDMPDDEGQQDNSVVEKSKNAFVPIGTNDKKRENIRKRLLEEMKRKKKAKKATPKKKMEEPKEEKKEEKKEENGITQEDRQIVFNQIALKDYPDLYKDINVDLDKLGCIMLDTVKIPVAQYVEDSVEEIIEVTSEVEPHVTLLYGLLENGNIWKDKVNELLAGWSCKTVTIREIDVFDLDNRYAVVALLDKEEDLIDGHERLTLLPHLSTFSEYVPHITLAYLKPGADIDKWVKALSKKYNGQKVATTKLNYGYLPEDEDQNNDVDDKTNNHIEDEHDLSHLPEITDEEMREAGFEMDENGKWHKKDDAPEEVPENDLDTSALSEEKEKKDIMVGERAKVAKNRPESLTHPHNQECTHDVYNYDLEMVKNALSLETQDNLKLQEGSLQQAAKEVEDEILQMYFEAIEQGGSGSLDDVISASQEKKLSNRLSTTLAAYFFILYPIYAKQLLAKKTDETGQQGTFAQTKEVEAQLRADAKKAAESHVKTIIKDIQKAITKAFDETVQISLVQLVEKLAQEGDKAVLSKLPDNPNLEDIQKAVKKGVFNSEPIYERARQLAKEGFGQAEIARKLRQEYQDITRLRSTTIARHETNRIFNISQYEADKIFLKQAKLTEKAYKVLTSNSGSPCPICADIIKSTTAHPIPFYENFVNLGDTITVDYTKENGKTATAKMTFDYEPIEAGNVHVNCHCTYKLLILQDDGTFLNAYTSDIVENAIINKEETQDAEVDRTTPQVS